MTKKIDYLFFIFIIYLIHAINHTIITNDSWFKVLENLRFGVQYLFLGLPLGSISCFLSISFNDFFIKIVNI